MIKINLENFNREFKKAKARFKTDSRIKECFHFDKKGCNKKIISAHSLQKNGVLSLIEENVNGNQVVYSFLHLKMANPFQAIGFEPLGKKIASTFHGFCGHHDTEIFKEIENKPFNINDDKHRFLLSYRSFAKEFHSKQETNKGFSVNEIYGQPHMQSTQEGMIKGSNLAIRDNKYVKDKLNSILKKQEYKTLKYFSHTINYTIPIACASSFSPSFSYQNELLNRSTNPDDIYENIIITVLPTKNKTHILLACLPEQSKSIQYINQLSELKDTELERAISSILIGDNENTFISPSLWKKLTEKEKHHLLKELFLTSPQFEIFSRGFFHSELNLFDIKYSKEIN